jgi:hypothetical protein
VLGEQCATDAECGTGLCTGVCSTCLPALGCDGSACRQAYTSGPYVCRSGERAGARGAPCAVDDDCASGTCNGPPRRQCADARACSSDAGCPLGPGLPVIPCSTVGVQGGSCN